MALWSWLVETMRWLFGDQARPRIGCVCPVQVEIGFPLAASHTSTVEASPAKAIYWPLGDQTSVLSGLLCGNVRATSPVVAFQIKALPSWLQEATILLLTVGDQQTPVTSLLCPV